MSQLINFKGKPVRICSEDKRWLERYSGQSWSRFSMADFEFVDIMNDGDRIMAMSSNGRTYRCNSSGDGWTPVY